MQNHKYMTSEINQATFASYVRLLPPLRLSTEVNGRGERSEEFHVVVESTVSSSEASYALW